MDKVCFVERSVILISFYNLRVAADGGRAAATGLCQSYWDSVRPPTACDRSLLAAA